MKMLRISTLLSIIWAATLCLAQPSGYYKSVQGLKKAELKTALHNLIQPSYVPAYGGKGEGYTWWGFTMTDRMPDGSVRDRYSKNRYEFNGLNAVGGMNIEHSFANSWWGHTMNNAYCDLHHLYPSDSDANGRKSNNPIGVVDGTVSFDNGVTRIGRSTSYRADSLITVWEPADEWKGDFARTYFYMSTCYEDYVDAWQTTEGLLMVERNRYPTLRPWVTNLLLEWSRQDPVDDIERQRNDAVYEIQGNRNPFIDHPQLAEYIWGEKMSERFYTSEIDEPELFTPANNQVFDFGLCALSRGLDVNIVLRGCAVDEDLSLDVTNEEFVLGTSMVTPHQLLDGIRIPVICKPAAAGVHSTTLTINGGGISCECLLRAEFIDGLPAYPASDIVCSVNSKRFTASWMKWADGEIYTLDVRGADGKSLSGYPIETTDTALVVSGLKANTTYTYEVVTKSGLRSNMVTVEMPEVTPVFSANASAMAFVSVPNQPSRAQIVTITAIEVKEYKTSVEVTAPFEVSADGESWGASVVLTGASQTLYVRLGALHTQGIVEGELVLETRGLPETIISLAGEIDPKKAFFENFESGSKNAYAEASTTASAATWNLVNTLMGSTADDSKNDSRGLRMRVQNASPNEVVMLDDFVLGCDSLWFWAGPYNKDTNMKLAVYYSVDGGINWESITEALVLPNATWQRYGYELKVDKPLRLRFVASGANGKRVNIDDIQMSSYKNDDIDAVDAVYTSNECSDKVYTVDGICHTKPTLNNTIVIRRDRKSFKF